MSYTKAELVKAALNELGIADYEFDISPGEIVSGVRRLDAMMARWSDKGLILSYDIGASSGESSNIPDIANEAVITNLALRLAPSYGKQAPPEVKITAKFALSDLYSSSARAREVQFPSMPKGAGYKSFDEPYSAPPKEEYLVDVDESIDLSGGPNGT